MYAYELCKNDVVLRKRLHTYLNRPIELTYGRSFNQQVDELPFALTRLTFGNNFNQPPNELPFALTRNNFNHNRY